MADRESRHRAIINDMARQVHETKRRNNKPTTLEGERHRMREVAKRHDRDSERRR